jgi:hypothetical protein
MMNTSLCPCVPAISIRHLSQPTVGSSQCGVHPAKDQQPGVNTTNMNSRYSGELYHILVESPRISEFHVDQGARFWIRSRVRHPILHAHMFTQWNCIKTAPTSSIHLSEEFHFHWLQPRVCLRLWGPYTV